MASTFTSMPVSYTHLHQRYLEKHPRGYCHVAPWKLAALPDFPFSTKTYTRPAKELLQTWKEAGEVSF